MIFDISYHLLIQYIYFQLSNEVGDYAHIPDEGVMKPPADEDNYWWSFDNEEESDKKLANKLITIYFSFFKASIKKGEIDSKLVIHVILSMTFGVRVWVQKTVFRI